MWRRAACAVVVFVAVLGPAVSLQEDLGAIVPEEQFVATSEEKAEQAVPPVKECSLNVKKCFATAKTTAHPVWKQPVSDFTGSYKLMCAPEIKAKLVAKEGKKKAEVKHKALCKKEELDQKYTEKKLKQSIKKEALSKKVGEGKQKYLTKKLKRAEEVTVKTAGKDKEFANKLSEKSNKREDKLYKQECASKEKAFKAVREGKQKMRVVYVKSVPKTTKPPVKPVSPVKPVKPVAKKKPAPAKPPAPKPVKAVKKKPVKPVVKKETHISSLKEVLLKTGERSDKAQIRSHELMQKSNTAGKLAVAKEAIVKGKELKKKHAKAKKDHAYESKSKEKDQKEDASKSESKTKLKIDRMKLKAARQESKSKIVKPPKKKPCNPVTALEKYVKKCKHKEELFAKAKIAHEAEVKEIKTKDKLREENKVCKLVHDSCKQIYTVSEIREQHIVKLVHEHTKELEASMKKTEALEHKQAMRMKYHICESAAKDMKYFVNKLLYTVPHMSSGGTKKAGGGSSGKPWPLHLGLTEEMHIGKKRD